MKKLNKKDIIYLAISIIFFILLVLFVTDNTFLYASSSNIDYINYADYFRKLFYETKDLFPDFALTINNGINIYNLVEYGFLNPIIIISYLLPFISMHDYIIISTIFLIILSTILLYKFLYNHKYSSEVCFISSFLFILSTSITYNSHNNLVLINYMPFLILSLMGVDKIFKDNKSYILIISLFLSLMTNLKYSLISIITILIYALYKYLERMNKPTLKTFFKRTITIIGPILVSLLCSSILLIPYIFINIDKSTTGEVIVNLKELLLPNINTNNILYSPLGLGLTSIVLLAIVNIFNKKKSYTFLGITLTLLIVFNIFKYSINNLLLIFMPLYILAISEFLKDLFNKKIIPYKITIPIVIISILILIYNYRINRYTLDILTLLISILLFYLSNKKILFIIPILTFAFLNAYTINMDNNLQLRNTYIMEKELNSELSETIDYYDNTFYRLTKDNTNIIELLLTNNKYLLSKYKPLIGYKEVTYKDGIHVYYTEDSLPLGFSTPNVMSYEDFDLLETQTQQEALLNVIVADTVTSNNFIPTIEKITLDYEDIFKGSKVNIDKNGIINISTTETLKFSYELPKKYHNKILFLNFNAHNVNSLKSIKINSTTNYLVETDQYNNIQKLNYVLASQEQTTLFFSFEPGEYTLSNFETYILDSANIDKSIKKIDKFIIDNSSNEEISGRINVLKDGYFMLSIPYSKGFDIKLNNNEIKYEKVDEKYIGFPISSGTHNISIKYRAPGKLLGSIMSISGIIVFIAIIYLESKRKI